MAARGLVTGIVALGAGELMWTRHTAHAVAERARAAVVAEQAEEAAQARIAMPAPHRFQREAVYDFLEKVRRAEALADPLARCLAYPDPPGSHWQRDTVAAYCRYNLQPIPTFAQLKALVEQGRAAELDRRLADALHAQQTVPASRGLLDRIYRTVFYDPSFAVRAMCDAWKRQSPDSPYALAASGTSYIAMAWKARGSDSLSRTPDSAVRSMENLVGQATGDLRRALALEPGLVPAYLALIDAAGLDGRAQADGLIRQALAQAPDDYSIYERASWVQQPNWGGSLAAMDALARQAQQHVATNPMLRILLAARPYYQVHDADLEPADESSRYPTVLAGPGSVTMLERAGGLASTLHEFATAAVYRSEVLRFRPGNDQARVDRAYALLDFDEAAWAVRELDGMLARAPRDRAAREARAYAYDLSEAYASGVRDLRTLIADDPRDLRPQWELGVLYMHWGHHRDEAWAVADGMIRDQPRVPAGWMLRAMVQEQQPRAGLDDTVREIEARFGNQPQMARTLLKLRAAVALRQRSGIDAPAHAPAEPSVRSRLPASPGVSTPQAGEHRPGQRLPPHGTPR